MQPNQPAKKKTRTVVDKENKNTSPRKMVNKMQPNVEQSEVPPFEGSRKQKPKREHIIIQQDNEPIGIKPPYMDENLLKIKKMCNFPEQLPDDEKWDKYADKDECPDVKRYQALVSLMLKSHTKEPVLKAAMERLLHHGCTVAKILETPKEKLEELLKPVIFYKIKVGYIKNTTAVLDARFGGIVPRSLMDLSVLHGLGPSKLLDYMRTAWSASFEVGPHLHRIANRIGWVNTTTPEKTQKELKEWLPNELWTEIDFVMTCFGERICHTTKPNCSKCLNYEFCPQLGVEDCDANI